MRFRSFLVSSAIIAVLGCGRDVLKETEQAESSSDPRETVAVSRDGPTSGITLAGVALCTSGVQMVPVGHVPEAPHQAHEISTVDCRTPADSSHWVFPKRTVKLFCVVHVKGAKKRITIAHRWYLNDKEMAEVKLPVKSVSWRTRSSKNIAPEWTGNWKVEIANLTTGKVLKTIHFSIE